MNCGGPAVLHTGCRRKGHMIPNMHPALAGLIGVAVTLVVMALVVGVRRGIHPPHPTGAISHEEAGRELRRLVDGLPWAAMLVGSDDEVLAINNQGLDAGIGVGSRIGHQRLLKLVRTTRRANQPFRGELELPRGPEDALALAAAVIPLARGHVLVVGDDLTATRRVEATRRDFLNNVTHELKTPIGAISILSEALAVAEDDPEAVSLFAGRLRQESLRLAELVEQIIDLSRLEVAPRLNLESVAVEELVQESLTRTRVLAQSRHVDLVSDVGARLLVRGDRGQLTDAITNLVNNAIVYSGRGARVAVVATAAEEGGRSFVDVRVADNGIGIAPEDQERIFERFFRVDYGRSRDNGGTGLGLSIVDQVAQAHGGSVSLWSEPGQGSTFTLRLPRQAEGEGQAA